MNALVSTSKLYDLLAGKIGKQTAESLLIFVKENIKSEMEYHGKALATNDNLFKVRSELKDQIVEVRSELKEEIAAVRTELKGEIAAVRTELKGEIAAVRTELKGEIAAVRTDLTKEMSTLQVNVEKGFKQQFWLIIAMFLPFYFTLVLLVFRML